MPNHVTTHLHLEGEQNEIEKFFDKCVKQHQGTGEYYVDFREIIPCQDHYEEHRDRWGTKWNSYDGEANLEERFVMFQTAWTFPSPIMRKLGTMFPLVKFNFVYADEDWGYNTGRGFVHGNCFVIDPQSHESNQAMENYLETHESMRDYFVKNDNGKWEYKEIED